MFSDYWITRRKYSPRALLEQRNDRVASLRDEITASLPFEHLDKCPFEEGGDSRCEQTIVAMFDRYGFPVRLAVCSHSGLLYLVDRLTAEGYYAFYETGLYRRLIAEFKGRANTEEALFDDLIRQAKVTAGAAVNALQRDQCLPANASLLDVGGSIGIIARAFVDAFRFKATVLDPSEKELEVAAARGLEVKRGTIEQAVFAEDEKYDIVLIIQTIEHLVNIRDAFTNINTILKAGGYVIFDIVDFIAVSSEIGCAQAASRLDHCHFMYDEMMDVFCKRVGLVIEKRIWYWRTRILYVCRKATPDPSIRFPEETRLRITRDLLSQYVVWYATPRILQRSLVERIFSKLTNVFSFK
jgi:ubiquinone/menaquinone biosynthesis C-methylase UbiE